MGMYTELILGCELSDKTPKVCIDALNHVINGNEEKQISEEVRDFIKYYSLKKLFWRSSYYFGVSESHSKMWYDDISKSWIISTRSNLKNYNGEIETFLEYIIDYVKSGSGIKDIFAYVLYENSALPTIYSKAGILQIKHEAGD